MLFHLFPSSQSIGVKIRTAARNISTEFFGYLCIYYQEHFLTNYALFLKVNLNCDFVISEIKLRSYQSIAFVSSLSFPFSFFCSFDFSCYFSLFV